MDNSDSLENLCKEAAKRIAEADFFLLAAGAGFSADSGLAVYKDIANVPAYNERKLSYPTLCDPSWIEDDPELFYGFWGKCFNDYRDTIPHEGYSIIKNWKKKLFSSSTEAGKLLKEEWESRIYSQTQLSDPIPGPFFIYTSNVDHHSLTAGFSPEEVYEIHGSTEVWQCSDPTECKEETWSAPSSKDFRFEVNLDTMLAPKNRTKKKKEKEKKEENATETGDDNTEEKTPSVSLVEKLLQKVSLKDKQPKGFESNHPQCIFCKRPARPAILMFGDWRWVSDKTQGRRYQTWEMRVSELVRQQKKKLVIVEIGCGKNVPTVRHTTEALVKRGYPNTTLIRINPDFPLADNITQGIVNKSVVSIKSKGLHALKLIDASLQTLLKKN